MKFTVLTLFPNEFSQFFLKGLIGKAFEKKLFQCDILDIRDFAQDKHRHVDDYPYGHQTGMLLKVDVLYTALCAISDIDKATLIYVCPKGKKLSHELVKNFVETSSHIVIICGYYEGIDERIFDLFPITRVSLGDFVLTSGEIPALAIMDSVIRRIPGVLGNTECLDNESIISHVLESPQYTRPAEFKGLNVPDVLVSGHHQNIKKWEDNQAFRQTLFKKPSLLSKEVLSESEQTIIVNVLKNQAGGVYDK